VSSAPEGPSYVRSPAAAFLNSLPVDRGLVRHDLAGSIAHVEMLGRAGLLSEPETAQLRGGLRAIALEVEAGTFPWRDELEDVHTNVEVRLTELVGPVGGKLHTARSRNDQVALDERLYLRATVRDLVRSLLRLEDAVLDGASAEATTAMPGYTHLQRAQPVTVGHLLLAHFWQFDRDVDRLLATVRRAAVSPLGAGALAGSTLPIDPAWVAARLGFDRAFENSLDAVSDRDPFAELLFDLALFGVHASGLAEEVVLFASAEFGFLERTPGLGAGSSLMPQKRNPDVAELVRGKAGGPVGDLVALLTTLKGVPLAYDRDLQEDKAPVLRAVATAQAVASALTDLLRGLRFNRERLRAASLDPDLLATDRAEALVRTGVPFREAHESVGAAVRETLPHPAGAVPDGLASAPTVPDVDADPAAALGRRNSPGGPGPLAVAAQLALARDRRAARESSLSSLDRAVELTEELTRER
jgi:argininosuccinate lyase